MKCLPSEVVVLALLGAALGGCGASPASVVGSRAANEFECPAEQLRVEELGGSSYRATGCGSKATYTCLGGNFGNPYDAACTREGNVEKDAATSSRQHAKASHAEPARP